MRYYAVTNDPNELMHFGIKGMKWGILRTPEQLGHPRHSGSRRKGSSKPKSAAYKKASAKLSNAMKNGINKVKADWKEYNSPANRNYRAYKKYQKQTNRAIELARKGKLKYGKLDDAQVQRITERLNLERQARELSSKEQRFRTRLAKSIGEGVISGIGGGVSKRMTEWIGRRGVLKTDRLRLEQQEDFDKRKEDRRIRNAEREAIRKQDREFKNMKRQNEYNFERSKLEDDYKFNRDQEQERRKIETRAANAYLYGAKYDNDGKISSDSLADFYNQKYVKKQTKQYEEAQARNKKAQMQLEAANDEVRRIEAARKKEEERAERQRNLERQAEIERQRKAKAEWAAEVERAAKTRERESAWESKQRRISDAREKEAYRSNLQTLYGETYRHAKSSGPKLRFGAYDNPEQPVYTPVKRDRKRPGRRR